MKLDFIKVEPIGAERNLVFVDYANRRGGARFEDSPVYPTAVEGQRLRSLRQERRITLRRATEILGITGVELSRLECGSLTLSADQWKLVFGAIENAADADRGK